MLSISVTLLFSWWAFRGTDFHQQWLSLKTANYWVLIPYVTLLLVVHLMRTWRWGALLSGIERVPFRKLNDASAIGFMMLIVLPFRLGEFARPFLIAQRTGIRRSAAMTTVVLERIVDGITIAVLLRVLLFFVKVQSPQLDHVRFGANIMFAIFGGGLAFLLFARWKHDFAVKLVRTVGGWVSPRLAEKVADIVDTFVGAMRQLPSPGQTVLFFVFTVAYWGVNGLGAVLLSRAFACSSGATGCQPMALSVFQGFVVLSVLVVGLMVPAAPGMMGTFQFAVKVGLSLFIPAAVVGSSGLAFANVMWFCQTVQQIGLGLLCMTLGNVSFRDVAGRLGEERPEPTKAVVPTSG